MNTFFLVCSQMQQSFNQKKELVPMVSIWMTHFLHMHDLKKYYSFNYKLNGKAYKFQLWLQHSSKVWSHFKRGQCWPTLIPKKFTERKIWIYSQDTWKVVYEWGKQAWQYIHGWMHGRMNQFGNSIVHFFATWVSF